MMSLMRIIMQVYSKNKNQERSALGLEILGKYFNFDTELNCFHCDGPGGMSHN